MSTYLFIIGKDSELSLAELSARYPDGKFILASSDFAILEVKQKINQSEFDKLGGVIKMGQVVVEADRKSLSDKLVQQLIKHHTSGKLNYGISVYSWSEKNLRPLLLDIKKLLKKEKVSSRFANQKFRNLSVAQYKGIKKKGVELLVAKDGNKFIIAEVTAVQDIDSYSKRDYYKPYRDMRVGMMPPKLAQIMINLTGDSQTIWDPFCGGGVLVMEGLLMKHDMLGSDIAQKHLDGAVKNVDWLQSEYAFKNPVDLFIHDATQPLIGKQFDAIVCEGYLGPPQSRIQSADNLEPLTNELDRLYTGFFNALRETDFKGPVVIALPFFRIHGGKELDLSPTIKKIEKLGFKKNPKVLKYARPDQVVGRGIYRFEVL
jgi:tRNA G10  N-methylase Trm11